MKAEAIERFTDEFGTPARVRSKVTAWDVAHNLGVVVQTDQPNRENAAYVWLPYPQEGQTVPEIALQYAGEAGRHSGTYASPGLKQGEPALKLIIRQPRELEDTVAYIKAMAASARLPEVKAQIYTAPTSVTRVNVAAMPPVGEVKPRREAIPRSVQREVWQRDGGRCVECASKEKLCFDHIVPFSRGGSNAVRNLQLVCEGCNLSKGNRI